VKTWRKTRSPVVGQSTEPGSGEANHARATFAVVLGSVERYRVGSAATSTPTFPSCSVRCSDDSAATSAIICSNPCRAKAAATCAAATSGRGPAVSISKLVCYYSFSSSIKTFPHFPSGNCCLGSSTLFRLYDLLGTYIYSAF
jgi:hypothetical protein